MSDQLYPWTDEQADTFLQGYVEGLAWASPDDAISNAGYTFDDLALQASQRAETECNAFLYRAWYYFAGPDWSRHGHRFALSRNRHGSGFFDAEDLSARSLLQGIAISFDEYNFNPDDFEGER